MEDGLPCAAEAVADGSVVSRYCALHAVDAMPLVVVEGGPAIRFRKPIQVLEWIERIVQRFEERMEDPEYTISARDLESCAKVALVANKLASEVAEEHRLGEIALWRERTGEPVERVACPTAEEIERQQSEAS